MFIRFALHGSSTHVILHMVIEISINLVEQCVVLIKCYLRELET